MRSIVMKIIKKLSSDLYSPASLEKDLKRVAIILSIHIIWWLAIIMIMISMQGLGGAIKIYGSSIQLYGNVTNAILKGTITFYFLIYVVALPMIKTGNKKKALIQFLLFLLVITAYDYVWDYKLGLPTPAVVSILSLGSFLFINIGLDILAGVISIFIATWIASIDAIKRESELEKQRLSAELSAIKYQINPHFLFNSLSFIYTKTVRQNPEAAHAVHLLSEIMSYALQEWEELGRVPLTLEITHMTKVIEMNTIRFNNKLNVEYLEDIQEGGHKIVENTYIPTLAFITLVENAFKHGDLNDENNKIKILLQIAEDNICFSVSNKKRRGTKEPSHGIGLNNVQQRLQLMYGSNQTLIIKQDAQSYHIEINIKLIKS